MAFDIVEQIACVKREISMRERVYPRWQQDGKITQAKLEHELGCMRAVLETLQRIDAQQRPELAL